MSDEYLNGRLQLTGDGSYTLYSYQFDATYHSHYGALTESKHVFIEASCQIEKTPEDF